MMHVQETRLFYTILIYPRCVCFNMFITINRNLWVHVNGRWHVTETRNNPKVLECRSEIKHICLKIHVRWISRATELLSRVITNKQIIPKRLSIFYTIRIVVLFAFSTRRIIVLFAFFTRRIIVLRTTMQTFVNVYCGEKLRIFILERTIYF